MTNLQIDPEVLKLGEEARETEQGPGGSKRLTTLVEEHKVLAALKADLVARANAVEGQMKGIRADLFTQMAEAGLQNFKLADGTIALIRRKRVYGLIDNSWRQEALDWLLEMGAVYELNPTETALTTVCNARREAGESLPAFVQPKESEYVVVKGGK